MAVAYRFDLGETPKKIGADLDIHVSEVTREKKRAIGKHWLKPAGFTWTPPSWLSDEDKAMIMGRRSVNRDRLKMDLRRVVHTSPLQSVEIIGAEQAGSEIKFGQQAARYLAPLLQKARVCGVAWGSTLLSAVDRLEKEALRSQAKIIPVAGEPLSHRENVSSSSLVANRLTARCGRKEDWSLQGVPARIPRDLTHGEVLATYAKRSSSYKTIFGGDGGPTGLITKMDMLVSGMGEMDQDVDDAWWKEIKEMEGAIGLQELRDGAVGDIAGIWLSKPDATNRQKSNIDRINARWLGMNESHVKACALRGAKGSPGVVLLARRRSVVPVVLRALGMVNHLIVSKAVADGLLEAVGR